MTVWILIKLGMKASVSIWSCCKCPGNSCPCIIFSDDICPNRHKLGATDWVLTILVIQVGDLFAKVTTVLSTIVLTTKPNVGFRINTLVFPILLGVMIHKKNQLSSLTGRPPSVSLYYTKEISENTKENPESQYFKICSRKTYTNMSERGLHFYRK